jgi:hypothetical protein
MAPKKKTKIKKKRQKTIVPVKEIITEWEDWKAGDLAWGQTFASKKTIYGEIKEFYPEDRHGPAVTLLEAVEGAYITILVSTLSDQDPKKIRIRRNKKTSKT